MLQQQDSNLKAHKTGIVSQTKLMNILLLRSFIYIAYLKSKSNYMFRHFYLGHHQVELMSCSREL